MNSREHVDPESLSGLMARSQRQADDLAELCRETFQEGLERGVEMGRQHQAELDRMQVEYDAELAQIRANRWMNVDYIRGSVGEGYIYVIAFTTGTVKVGQTEDPKTRLNTHQSKALALGVGASNYWISPPHRNFKANEIELIRLCSNVSRRSRLEYFHEVGYERARQFARELNFDSAIPDQSGVECGWS